MALTLFAPRVGFSLQPSEDTPDFRLRISVDLVQVDAIITDSHDRPITDLTRQDFRVLLDGKPQEVRFCSFVQAGGRAAAAPEAVEPATPNKLKAARPAMPAAPLKREDVRRAVVLFVDDLSMSSESIPAVRQGIRRFIETQMQPGDLVAIVRASAGLGALQDFTPDKRLLLAATDHVRWTPAGRGAGQAYGQMGINPGEAMAGGGLVQLEQNQRIIDYTLAAASSLRRVVKGMAGLPGRKSIVILSDTMPLTTPDEVDPSGSIALGSGAFVGPIVAAMRRAADASARAGVVLYAIDTRGLDSLTPQAKDRILGPTETAGPRLASGPDTGIGDRASAAIRARHDEYAQGQWGAMFLAAETGGFMVTEANRIDAAIGRVMNDQSGYYLLGFTPPAETLLPGRNGRPDYHRVKVEVLRPGLRVRSHQGFYGVPDEERTPAERPELQLAALLESPFKTSGLGVEVQASFLNARKNDSFIRTSVFIDGRDLTLTGPAINRSGIIDLLVKVFSVRGEELPGGIDQKLRINLNEEGYERALKYGLVYTTLLPVPKPGPYQVRAACRDESTGKTGTDSDFTVVPKLKGRRMALSGVVFQNSLGVDDHVVPASGPGVLVPGRRLRFAFQVINGKAASPSGAGRLSMRTSLYRDWSTKARHNRSGRTQESPPSASSRMPRSRSRPTSNRANT